MTDKTMKYVYHFTRKEIEATGAKFADVKEETILKLDALRTKINRPFVLVKNGLTTGQHKSKQHGQGEAVDDFLKISTITPRFLNARWRLNFGESGFITTMKPGYTRTISTLGRSSGFGLRTNERVVICGYTTNS